MSYKFLMMKPAVEMRSGSDFNEKTILQQDPAVVVSALSKLFPNLSGRQESEGRWFGSLEGEDTPYEFRVGAEPERAWSIHTSQQSQTPRLIRPVCEALGLVAFDGQASMIIGPKGEWPA